MGRKEGLLIEMMNRSVDRLLLERKPTLKSQRHSRDACSKKMYVLAQKIMEQHKDWWPMKRNINNVKDMKEMDWFARRRLFTAPNTLSEVRKVFLGHPNLFSSVYYQAVRY